MVTEHSVKKSGSLTRRTLIQVAVRIAAVVIVATVISYYHVSSSLQAQALEQPREYVTQRGVLESSSFDLARDNLKLFAEDYLSHYLALDDVDPGPEFDALFVTHEDGTVRVRDRFYTKEGVSGVIGKQVGLSDDLRRRLILAYDMLARYGPAWRNRLVNLYVMTPEGAMLMYWPDMPWGLSANSWEVQARLAHSMAQGVAEAEIDRQRDALHQSEKLSALGSLLAGVAHELNNPLSVVVGRAGMMEQEAEGSALKDQTRKIREAAERCAK